MLESLRSSVHWLRQVVRFAIQHRRYPRFAPENLAANAAKVGKVAAIAAERGVTAAQLSLAWVQSQGVDVVPIPVRNMLAHGGCERFL